MRAPYYTVFFRLIGALLALPAYAQQPVAADSARTAPAAPAMVPGPLVPTPVVPEAKPLRRRIGFVLSLDNRQSFVQASAVRIIGLNAGIVLPNRRWRVGLGG